jgi:hypothetical protein
MYGNETLDAWDGSMPRQSSPESAETQERLPEKNNIHERSEFFLIPFAIFVAIL